MAQLPSRYTLTLCPARGPYPGQGEARHLADTRVELEWDEVLFAAIGPAAGPPDLRRLQPRRLPSNVTFQWLGDDGLHERTCDARGHRLTYVTAGELAGLRPVAERQGSSAWNRAAFAMVAALPPDTPVVLFWG